MKSAQSQSGRTFGERIAGAFVGALTGLVLGGVVYGAIFAMTWMTGRLPPPSIVWTTVIYTSVFTFLFGDALGDVLTMLYRIWGTFRSSFGPRIEKDAEWIRPIVMSLVYAIPLVALLHWVVT